MTQKVKIKQSVLKHIKSLVKNPKLLEAIIEEVHQVHANNENNKEIKRLQTKLSGYKANLEALAERLGELPKGVSASLLYNQMEKLEQDKTETQEAIQGLEINSDHHRELPIDFESYQNWSLFHCHTINHCRK